MDVPAEAGSGRVWPACAASMHAMPSATFQDRLHAYAELLVRVGVNIQSGQKLIIRGSTEAAPLVRECAAIAYQLGSPYVDVHWNDDGVTRARFLHGPEGSFGIVPEYKAQGLTALAEEGAASLSIIADDPDALAGTDPERFATFLKVWRGATKRLSELTMRDAVPWSVAAAAAPAWAKRVFPELSEDEAVARLWDAIFSATRMDLPDPVAAWREHNDVLKAKRHALNEHRFASLHLRGPGTDLTVGLADDHLWDGGGSTSERGIDFVANMPTEEVFTAPHRERVDGVVRASMPLSYNGQMIEDFELRFENGAVVEARAGKGQGALDGILATDEGARRLGEIALVPASSPIARTGLLFLETLFDENAACHLALGRAYPTNLAGSQGMTREEQAAKGLNDSLAHVDFMFGSAELDVDGIKADGSVVPVMRAGEWAL